MKEEFVQSKLLSTYSAHQFPITAKQIKLQMLSRQIFADASVQIRGAKTFDFEHKQH